MFDIITIGSATQDVFMMSKGFKLIKSSQFKSGIGECFSYGSKVEIDDLRFDTGGGATNAAYTFSNLNLKTSIVTRVGHDIYGLEILKGLAENNIKIDNIVMESKGKTAYSTILITPGGDRTILVYRGVSSGFKNFDFNWKKLKTKWIYLTSLGGNLSVLKSIFAQAKKNNINISWNPGSGELKLGKSINSFIKQASVFNHNLSEAQRFTGKKNINEIFKALSTITSAYILVTDGANGAYLSDSKVVKFIKPLKTKVINTTGAGDAFGSAFCAGLILKNDGDFAARLAAFNGAGVVSAMGAKNGLLKKLPSQNNLNQVKISIINKF